jgi:hypothetical protein
VGKTVEPFIRRGSRLPPRTGSPVVATPEDPATLDILARSRAAPGRRMSRTRIVRAVRQTRRMIPMTTPRPLSDVAARGGIPRGPV